MAITMQSPHAVVGKWIPCTSGLGTSPACADARFRDSLSPQLAADLTQSKRFFGSWTLSSSTLTRTWRSNGARSLHHKQRDVCVAWIGQSGSGPSHKRSGQSTRKEAVKVGTRVLERQHLDSVILDGQHANDTRVVNPETSLRKIIRM